MEQRPAPLKIFRWTVTDSLSIISLTSALLVHKMGAVDADSDSGGEDGISNN